MKIKSNIYLKSLTLFCFILINSLLFSQGINEEILPDSSEFQKPQLQINNQNFYNKDIFGNPILEEQIEEHDEIEQDELEEDLDSHLGKIYFYILAAPFYLPIILLEENCSETFYFQKYPFENDNGITDYKGRKWMGNFSLSMQYIDKDWLGYEVNSTFRFLRFIIEPSYSFYTNKSENISTLDANLLYTFAQSQYINFNTGFGYSYLINDAKDGIIWLYQVSLFQEPFNLNLEYNFVGYDLGSNKSNTDNKFKLNFGYFINRFEFKLGYRWQKIGEVNLSGPNISSTFWF